MPYEHIRISRDEPIRERHRTGRYFPPPAPLDLPGFGNRLRGRLRATMQSVEAQEIGGFDDRLLLRVSLRVHLLSCICSAALFCSKLLGAPRDLRWKFE